MLVPAWPANRYKPPNPIGALLLRIPGAAWLLRVGQKVDLTAVLETVWFLTINVGTMYMFLFRPFVWRNSDGEVLDDGRAQRFLW